jgi:tetratricopeptide (TPR) repeat protein
MSDDSTLLLPNQALELSRELGYSSGEAKSLFYLSLGHNRLGNVSKALELIHESLKVSEANSDTQSVVYGKNFLANFYAGIEDYQKASLYLMQALQNARKSEDSLMLIIVLANMGNNYIDLNDLDSASIILEESIQLVNKYQLQQGTAAYTIMSMAALQAKKKQFELAINNYLKTIPIWNEINDKGRLSQVYYSIADLHKEKGQPDSAFYFAEKSYSYAKEFRKPELFISEPSQLLSELYEKNNNFQEALRYHKIAAEAKEKMNKEKIADLSRITSIK